MYIVLVRPFSSKLQTFVELCSQIDIAVLFGFMMYVHFQGNSISDRSLMNVGYCMIGVIMFGVSFNLITLIVMSTATLIAFFRTKKKSANVAPHVEF